MREMTLNDTEALLLVFSDAETMKFYPKPFDRQKTEAWVKWNRQNYRHHGFGLWALMHKESHEYH